MIKSRQFRLSLVELSYQAAKKIRKIISQPSATLFPGSFIEEFGGISQFSLLI